MVFIAAVWWLRTFSSLLLLLEKNDDNCMKVDRLLSSWRMGKSSYHLYRETSQPQIQPSLSIGSSKSFRDFLLWMPYFWGRQWMSHRKTHYCGLKGWVPSQPHSRYEGSVWAPYQLKHKLEKRQQRIAGLSYTHFTKGGQSNRRSSSRYRWSFY